MARSRQHERIQRNDKDDDTIYKFLRIVKKYFPSLMNEFRKADSTDPRKKNYIHYSLQFILVMLFFKNALTISSMTAMVSLFENSKVISNLMLFGFCKYAAIPCIKTINQVLAILPPSFLMKIRHKIIFTLIRSKRLNSGRFRKLWVCLVDGTQTYGGEIPINDHCLTKTHNRGKENEHTTYHRYVLEAKLWLFGTKYVFSLGTEFIENDPNAGPNDTRGQEKVKQDCELAAFKRLAQSIKNEYPRLDIVFVFDALYVSQNVMQLCKDNNWHYVIRYKDGTASSIMDEVKAAIKLKTFINIPNQTNYTDIGFCSSIEYYGHFINFFKATSRLVLGENGKVIEKAMNFMWITDLTIKRDPVCVLELINLGRGRWCIENQGFNRQKRWENLLEHLCSWNDTALKNHYMLIQLADIFRTLMEMDENKAEEKKVYASNGKYKSLKRAFTEVSNALRESFKKSIIRESVHWLELKVLIEYDAAV